jgi:fibronectin type 3 domain-containing protein
VPQSAQATVSASYSAAQTAGDLNVVVIGWNDTSAHVQSVVDSNANVYALAVGPTVRAGFATQSIYYAKNIQAAAAGANVVTITFDRAAQHPDLRIVEYKGLDTVSPLDVVAAASGNSNSSSSGSGRTTNANDLIVGANMVATRTTAAGSGFVTRIITSPDGDILEDRVVTAAGNYSATATISKGAWVMQLVAFRAASGAPPDTQAPSAPAGLAASVASSSEVDLTWTPSTDNVGVANYLIERCQGSGCTSFAQIGTTTTASFSNTGLAASTTYLYRVRATDAAGNLSGYSNIASGTTQAGVDTIPPSAPSNLAANVASSAQINLSWAPATDNVAVTNYLVESCSGANCSSFALVGGTAGTTFSAASLNPSTSYSFRVRAADAAGNIGPYSNTAVATTQAVPDTDPPTAPSTLTATASSATQINLVWSAGTDNVAITNYLIEECVGQSCTAFAQVAATSATTLSRTGLASSTTYSYRVRAADAAGNLSVYSPIATAMTFASATIAFVQTNNAVPQSSPTSVSVAYTAAQSAGNLNVVVIGWNAATGTVQSVTDTVGNSYALAVGPTVRSGFGTQSIYYAANIRGAAANGNTVKVTFNAATSHPDIRIAEYRGISLSNPVDVVAAATGNSATASSGAATTTSANDLIVGANLVSSFTTGAGTSFTSRVITSPDGDILEDRIVTAIGSYSATAPQSSGTWIMQMVAFKGGFSGLDTLAPTAPGSLTAAPVSAGEIDLAWNASTDNVGVVNYLIERCADAGCSSAAQIGTSGTTSYSDTTVAPATAYTYRVRATDAAGNLSSYSNTATATTPDTDTQPPSAPGTLTATAFSGTRVDLSWGPATDNVGVTGYRVEQCSGVGCTSFVKLATVTGTTYSDTGLTPNTSYSYVVRAQDAAALLGPYSNAATVATLSTVPELVAAYAFEEGSGTTVTDLSGTHNSGTLQGGAVWTAAGKFGKALQFNGTNAVVTIPDSASLHLTTAMTLEAWVNPSSVVGAWKDVVYKGNDNYFLESSTSSTLPAAGATIGGNNLNAFASTSLPTNMWTHLAETYDGATLRLYINGSQASSVTASGAIATSTNPLQIGGDSIFGQFFAGLIDEVRIYNVALTPTQIQADMATPLGGSFPTVTLNPASVAFGNQQTGTTSSPQTIALTNTGAASLAFSGFSITGTNAADFVETTTCASNLAPGSSCSISITFSPGAAGPRSATLVIADNAPAAPQQVPLTGTGSGFTISPRTATLTATLSQQFQASSGGEVVWAVDGVDGGTAASGLITASGVYTPGTSVGQHVVTVRTTDGTQTSNALVYVTNHPGVFTHHNDNARTGQNTNEIVLTPSNISSSSFGKLTSYSLDGNSHASPLYVAGVSIPGRGIRNIVYVATEHNSVYAFDADGLSTTPYWQTSFIDAAAGVTTVPSTDTGECCDIAPEIGTTGTPVVDPSTGTLYVVAKTKEVSGGTTNYRQRLHALDVATGAEKFGGPIQIQASVQGSGVGGQGGSVPFDPLHENQRPALLLSNGVVYIGFGSHGDIQPYHGWLLGYNATTLQQVFVHNSSPDADSAGMWQANGGPAADAAGNIYFVTGNGLFDVNTGGRDYGDSFVKVNPSGSVVDYFTPHNQANISANNFDLGAAGPLLLPDQPGAHPHLLVSAGKDNTVYMLDRDSMGHYNANNDNQIVQSLVNVFPFGRPEPGNYSAPVYFNGSVYFGPVADTVQAFKLTNGLLSTTPTSASSVAYPYPGATLSVSANGTANGIVWAIQRNGDCGTQATCGTAQPGVLRAYDASNLGIQLYSSDQAGSRDALDYAAKFSVPLVVNGKVFVTTIGRLTIYGLLP